MQEKKLNRQEKKVWFFGELAIADHIYKGKIHEGDK